MGVVHHANYVRHLELVRVRWLDGTLEDFGPLPAGSHLLQRGAGRPTDG